MRARTPRGSGQRRSIAWREIRRLDRTGWNAPLVLRLTLSGDHGPKNLVLIYPGDLDACSSLLRHLKRYSREALLDGVPYPKFWGEASARPRQLPPARYPVLRPEDEEEVERMFQRLKSEGSIEERGSVSRRGAQRGPQNGAPTQGPVEQPGPEEK